MFKECFEKKKKRKKRKCLFGGTVPLKTNQYFFFFEPNVLCLGKEKKTPPLIILNTLHPNIRNHILQTLFYTFP